MRIDARIRSYGPLLFAAGLALATGLTFWLGYRATREWQRSTAEAADRRGNEVVTLLAAALERDMKGGQISVLLKVHERELAQVAPYELADRFARGFARFPYLESFFVWNAGGSGRGGSAGAAEGHDGATYVFNRADRRPAWDRDRVDVDPFPVLFRRNPEPLRSTVLLVRAQGRTNTRYTMFEVSVEGVRYQVIAHLLYDGVGEVATLKSAVGFLVNLEWVQQHYFADFLAQMQQIIGDPSLTLQVLDNSGVVIASVGPNADGVEGGHVRHFAPVFAEQALSEYPTPVREATWATRVSVASESSLTAAAVGGTQTLIVLGIATLITIAGLAVSLRAARRAADLAEVQSEFVSAVSHEMKTPLSLIKLASDTLANRRYESPDATAEYGQMIADESRNLARLIDNVLCYARVTDSSSEYDMDVVDVAELVQESLDRFAPQLRTAGFDVQVQLPSEPPHARGDHMMLGHVFGNLVDNAVKYAASGRWLGVTVTTNARQVVVDIADRGAGIPQEERVRVFEKFYRGKGTRSRGSGLGLAIVRRIIEDHGGSVLMAGRPSGGSVVTVTLPLDTSSRA